MTKLKVAPVYLFGAPKMTRKFGGELYISAKLLVYKSAANRESKYLKEHGCKTHITEPEYTSPQGDPVYIVWANKKDYDMMINTWWKKTIQRSV